MIFQTAKIWPDAEIKNGVWIGRRVQIRRGVIIRESTQIDSEVLVNDFSQIGRHVSIGRGAVIDRGATLADHVTVGNSAFLPAGTRVGTFGTVAASSIVSSDIPPFAKMKESRIELNSELLRRLGLSDSTIRELRFAFHRWLSGWRAREIRACFGEIISHELHQFLRIDS